MMDDPHSATSTLNPPPAPPAKNKWVGCAIWGCSAAFVLVLLLTGLVIAISVWAINQAKDLNKVVTAHEAEFMKEHPNAIIEEKRIVDQSETSAQHVIRFKDTPDGLQQQITTAYIKKDSGAWEESLTTTTIGESITTSTENGTTITTTGGADERVEAPVINETKVAPPQDN